MIDVVVPTIGRPTLASLLESLARSRGPRPNRVFLVDDRRGLRERLVNGAIDEDLRARIDVLHSGGRGPAAARNVGWRAARAPWIAFLDDDVVVDDDWLADLTRDLTGLARGIAGSTGRVRVPMPPIRRPTDWERHVGGLASARWITADCAYRRAELLAVGGFDERFERAYREDADLALRVVARGHAIARGSRRCAHPVRPARWTISIRLQAGNADDVLMDALHGAEWRRVADAPLGAYPAHRAIVTAALVGVLGAAGGSRRFAATGAIAWAAGTAHFAWRRIAPGPRDVREIVRMLATSAVVPFAAVAYRVRGIARLSRLLADRERAPRPVAAAVLFDRDGTLIADVPGNVDPARVTAMPTAVAALARLRAAGIPTAVVSNQGAVGLGAMRSEDVAAINARAEALLGPLGPVFVCEHSPDAGCACRKPAPGLIRAAARALGTWPRDCVVIGDIGTDVEAARAAGARSILVATPVTRAEERSSAPFVADDLDRAVSAVLGGLA